MNNIVRKCLEFNYFTNFTLILTILKQANYDKTKSTFDGGGEYWWIYTETRCIEVYI